MLLKLSIIKIPTYSYFAEKGYSDGINLMDLPNEIIEKILFPYLGYNEINTLGFVNRRLKEITDSVMKTKCKCMKDILTNLSYILW